jgi:PKD repeat protein
MNVLSSVVPNAVRLNSRHVATPFRSLVMAFLLPVGLAACAENGLLEPVAPGAATVGTTAHADIVVTPDYSTFDTRAEFDGAGLIAHTDGFDEFTGGLVYPQPTPWTTGGVTYTSGFNIVLAPTFGLGIPSNSISTDFGKPITGTFAPEDAFRLFAADLTLIGSKVPVSIVLTTNVASYTFANLDIPLATTGTKFFGVGLVRADEYFTGFAFSYGGSARTGLLLDNVAVGHVADVNNAPVASAGGPYSANEGSPVSFAFVGTDADGDVLTYTWDLGDGTTGSGPTPPASHVYADDGAYDIALTVSDGRGGTHTAHASAVITNVAPTVAAFTLPSAPLALIPGGVPVNVSTHFTDPGLQDVHTAHLDCGTGALTQSAAPNGSAGGVCTFSAAGVYAVQLTVQDDDGGSDTRAATGQVVIYDPAAGWVTGGGWIASPEGAFAAAPNVTGKLTFGFVARYQRATETAPNGSADFKLQVSKLDFRSTSLDWLVVADGTAQLRGRGQLNGGGDYEFALTAVDGPLLDAIRIVIRDRVTGAVVYDNRPGEGDDADAMPLSGGSIQIHTR